MKMTRELARIKATQKRYEYAHYGRPTQRQEPVSFEEWMLAGIRKYEALGAEFQLLEPGMVKIQWPGRPTILRTVSDFEKEYNSLFPAQNVIFEEAAGITA